MARSFQTLIAAYAGRGADRHRLRRSGTIQRERAARGCQLFHRGWGQRQFRRHGLRSMVQTAGGALPALSASGGTNSLVSVDAMQEFRIQTSSFAPEFGRTPGGQISIVTRSGTNAFHGTLFEYFRNNVLDARDWFVNFNGLAKPEERQNDFGGVFGGPVRKDRTFFFFSYEGLRLRQPSTQETAVPDVASRQPGPGRDASYSERLSRRQRPGTWGRIGAIQCRLFESFLAGRLQHPAGSCRQFETEPCSADITTRRPASSNAARLAGSMLSLTEPLSSPCRRAPSGSPNCSRRQSPTKCGRTTATSESAPVTRG